MHNIDKNISQITSIGLGGGFSSNFCWKLYILAIIKMFVPNI